MAKRRLPKKKPGSKAAAARKKAKAVRHHGTAPKRAKRPARAQPAPVTKVRKKASGWTKAAVKPPASRPARESTRVASPEKIAASLKSEIRRLDRDILKLVNRRATATTKLLESSPNPQQAIFNPSADDELWEQIEQANPGPLPSNAVRGVFRQILSAARQQVKTQRVAYLGPPYSFTHLAAIERFGERADLIPVDSIASVFEEVNRGHAEYGLVPIENSTDGRIVDTLDMFTRLPLRICGEVQLSVHHNLLARCPRSEIVEVYSKPQALSQCREWLHRNMPQARLIEVISTSTAAQLARDKPGASAVASREAALEYGLEVIAEHIEDNKNNVTRFAVIGHEVSRPTKRDRTAILIQIPHKPGSLSDSLTTFKKNKINLTWIESFPLKGPEVGYLFFLDFEGHVNDSRTKRALAALEKKAVRLEVLGSYPRSEPLG